MNEINDNYLIKNKLDLFISEPSLQTKQTDYICAKHFINR